MEGFSFVPVHQMPPVKLVQQKLPGSNHGNILEADLSVISENQQTLYELITQAQPQVQKLAVSMHTPEQATQLGQLVTTSAAQVPNQAGTQAVRPQKIAVSMLSPEQGNDTVVNTLAAAQVTDPAGAHAILVQDLQPLHNLPTDYQEISYY